MDQKQHASAASMVHLSGASLTLENEAGWLGEGRAVKILN